MKKDCWAILGITRTKDTSIIKKAYRGLIKKYHPDTVQAPEKIRRYTIKSVEINKAYKEAMEYAATNQHEPEIILRTEQTVSGNAAPAQQKTGVFTRLFAAFILLLLIISPLFFPSFLKWYASMPLDSPLKIIISFPFAITLGALYNVVLSFFTILPVLYLWGVFSDTRYEKYMFKLGFLVVTALNISIIYFATDLYWPFEHRATAYYNFLYHLCRFLAWSCGPICMFTEWIEDYLKYLRVKDSLNSGALVLYEDD